MYVTPYIHSGILQNIMPHKIKWQFRLLIWLTLYMKYGFLINLNGTCLKTFNFRMKYDATATESKFS